MDHLVVCVVGFHTALTYIAPLDLVRFRQPSKIGVECGIQCFRKGIVVNHLPKKLLLPLPKKWVSLRVTVTLF